LLSFSENTQYNIDENVDDRGKLFDGEMDGDSEFNGWKSQQNIYLQLKVIPQKNVHKKRMSKDFELQNSKLAPMHNSSASKEPEDENITLRPETSKSIEEPENRLSKEPGKKKFVNGTYTRQFTKTTSTKTFFERNWWSKFV